MSETFRDIAAEEMRLRREELKRRGYAGHESWRLPPSGLVF
jgi:hypothetical protein